MDKPRIWRVTNGANGLFARMADVTEADGSSMIGIKFVGTGASKLNIDEALVVQCMCELHARRFAIEGWQGKFRIERA